MSGQRMRLGSAPSRLGRRALQVVVRQYAIRDNVHIGRNVHIGLGSTLWAPQRLAVGDDVYIGKRCTIEVDGMIGPGTIIGNNVGLVGRVDHDYRIVGVAMRIAVERGRAAKPEIKLGICGEHGGEPRSIAFCHELGLDYVSCSPFRVPLARLAAAQAALKESGAGSYVAAGG